MESLNPDNLHHAYLLVGEREAAREAVISLFGQRGVRLVGSPDFFVYQETLLGIDDARKIREQAIRRAFTESKVFFIAPDKITLEAQNALLKTFEEPIEHTHFFLTLRDENLAISTLRSRAEVVCLGGNAQGLSEARKFLSLPVKERLNFTQKFVDNEKNLSAFLDELLLSLRGNKDAERLSMVFKARLLSDDRGALPRLILEHLAVSL